MTFLQSIENKVFGAGVKVSMDVVIADVIHILTLAPTMITSIEDAIKYMAQALALLTGRTALTDAQRVDLMNAIKVMEGQLFA